MHLRGSQPRLLSAAALHPSSQLGIAQGHPILTAQPWTCSQTAGPNSDCPATEVHSHVPLPSFQVFLFVLVKSLKFLRRDTPILSFSFWGKASTLLLFPSNCRDPSLEEIWAEAGHLLTRLFMETNTRVAPLSALSMAQGSSHETQNSHTACQYSPAIIFFFFHKKS